MRVRLSQPALMPDLVDFLHRASCRTDGVHGATVEVELPAVQDATVARRDVDLFLAAWCGLHPGVRTTILG